MFIHLSGWHENPTKANIQQAFAWLVQGARAGDNLFLHYSGHGGSMKDDNQDEVRHCFDVPTGSCCCCGGGGGGGDDGDNGDDGGGYL